MSLALFEAIATRLKLLHRTLFLTLEEFVLSVDSATASSRNGRRSLEGHKVPESVWSGCWLGQFKASNASPGDAYRVSKMRVKVIFLMNE